GRRVSRPGNRHPPGSSRWLRARVNRYGRGLALPSSADSFDCLPVHLYPRQVAGRGRGPPGLFQVISLAIAQRVDILAEPGLRSRPGRQRARADLTPGVQSLIARISRPILTGLGVRNSIRPVQAALSEPDRREWKCVSRNWRIEPTT